MDTQSIIVVLLLIYLLFCYWQRKKVTDLCLIAILLAIQLPGWPFFLPRAYCDAGLAVAMASLALYDFSKERNRKMVIYFLVFIYFAIVFLLAQGRP